MTFSINLIKEKSSDPCFKLRVTIYDNSLKVENAVVEVLRLPPKVSFIYPDEIKKELFKIDQKKFELEILNKIVEYIMETTDKSERNTTVFFGRNTT